MVAAGSARLHDPVSQEALYLSGAEKPRVLLMATPKPTESEFNEYVAKTTEHFQNLGAYVTNLHDFDKPPSLQEATHKIYSADVLWVSGGDTIRMMNFWVANNIDRQIDSVARRGTVLAGGSAGMLAWMEAGHSDTLSYTTPEGEPWDYSFVRGLGYIAATGCPHFDAKTKGVEIRNIDFMDKFQKNRTLPPIGIGITNAAALAFANNQFKVITSPNTPRLGQVHIIRKTENGLTDELLPIQPQYADFGL